MSAVEHPDWCDRRLCTSTELATEHRETPTVLRALDGAEVGVHLYRMDEPDVDILPGDHHIVLTFTHSQFRVPLEVLLDDDDAEALIAALTVRYARIAALRQGVAR